MKDKKKWYALVIFVSSMLLFSLEEVLRAAFEKYGWIYSFICLLFILIGFTLNVIVNCLKILKPKS